RRTLRIHADSVAEPLRPLVDQGDKLTTVLKTRALPDPPANPSSLSAALPDDTLVVPDEKSGVADETNGVADVTNDRADVRNDVADEPSGVADETNDMAGETNGRADVRNDERSRGLHHGGLPTEEPLITPALFSHRPPPDREK